MTAKDIQEDSQTPEGSITKSDKSSEEDSADDSAPVIPAEFLKDVPPEARGFIQQAFALISGPAR